MSWGWGLSCGKTVRALARSEEQGERRKSVLKSTDAPRTCDKEVGGRWLMSDAVVVQGRKHRRRVKEADRAQGHKKSRSERASEVRYLARVTLFIPSARRVVVLRGGRTTSRVACLRSVCTSTRPVHGAANFPWPQVSAFINIRTRRAICIKLGPGSSYVRPLLPVSRTRNPLPP